MNMNNRIKILLPNERGVTSENVDLFLNIDLHREFSEFKKERFDNDFDLAAQFTKERNMCRNFIVYGEINSTVIDCVNVPIKVYRDPEYLHQIATIRTTKISYGQPNVFGKRNGKYYIKIENYKYDVVYFKISSNNFSYRDQKWSQRLVFYDADGNVVPYGTETIDINSNGDTSEIENDFPFFFNKHWIKNDYSIIEEKKSTVSFNVSRQTLSEGQVGELLISLNKPSPFGLEIARLNCLETSSNSDFSILNTFNDVGLGNEIISSVPITSDPVFQPVIGKAVFLAQVPFDKTHLISAGASIRILDGSYAGNHTIMYSRPFSMPPYSDLYQIVINQSYDPIGTNSVPMSFRAGTAPDISFSLNGTLVELPINISWQIDETVKTLRFSANTDFEVEFTEHVDLSLSDLLNCKRGRIMDSQILFEDLTERRYVSLFLGSTYENRPMFTGRTYSLLGNIQTNTAPSYSILRNGHRYEGRNEEFYPSSGYVMKIRNDGNRTLFPVNPDIGVMSESFFDIGETRTIPLTTKYVGSQRASVKVVFPTLNGAISGINSPFYFDHNNQPLRYTINGLNIVVPWSRRGYNAFKSSIDGSSTDSYSLFQIEKPFDVTFNEDELSMTFVSSSSGVDFDFFTNDETVTATTITNWFEKPQIEHNIQLLANSYDNTRASYSITIHKDGFRDLVIPRTELPADSTPIPYYLVTSYGNILRPYYDDIQQPYYGSASTVDDRSYTYALIINTQPTYMPLGPAFINGVCLLADNTIYGTKENLTNYGLGDGQFVAGFLPERVDPIVGTFENIVSQPTKKTVELTIPFWSSFTSPYVRSFDFRYGSIGNETVYTFGGNQYGLRNTAQWWWSNSIVAVDQNGYVMPNATLQERLDTGNNLMAEGPVTGELLSTTEIRLISKTAGNDFHIENIVNYVDAGESGLIAVKNVVPNLNVGNYNLGNNGLGGFSTSL